MNGSLGERIVVWVFIIVACWVAAYLIVLVGTGLWDAL